MEDTDTVTNIFDYIYSLTERGLKEVDVDIMAELRSIAEEIMHRDFKLPKEEEDWEE